MLIQRNQSDVNAQPFETAYQNSSNKKRCRRSSSILSSLPDTNDENVECNSVSVQDVVDDLEKINDTGASCDKSDPLDDFKVSIIVQSCTKKPSASTSAGVTLKGKKRENPDWQNQDCFGVSECDKTESSSSISMYFVCDGHGKAGHLVSAQCKRWLPNLLRQHTNFDQNQVFSLMHRALILSPSIDTDCSGCTCITAIIRENKTIEVGNVGDSRCILIRSGSEDKFESFPLSVDHKPSNADERKRIINAGGRVAPRQDYGPARVWFGYNQTTLGLAMSRSLGDGMAHRIGVSHEPDLYHYKIHPHDLFLIMATDGLWDVLRNDQVSELIHIYQNHSKDANPENMASFLVETARKRWESLSPENIDDITCLVVALNTEL